MTQMVRLFLIRVTAYVGFRITQPKWFTQFKK